MGEFEAVGAIANCGRPSPAGPNGDPSGPCSFFGLGVGKTPNETGAEFPCSWKKSLKPLESRFDDAVLPFAAAPQVVPSEGVRGSPDLVERVGDIEAAELRFCAAGVLVRLRNGKKLVFKLTLGFGVFRILFGLSAESGDGGGVSSSRGPGIASAFLSKMYGEFV